MRLKPRIMAGVLAVTMVVSLLQYPTGTVRAAEPSQETVDITDENNKTVDETENKIASGKTQEQEKAKVPDTSDTDDAAIDDTEKKEESRKPSIGEEDTHDEEEDSKDNNETNKNEVFDELEDIETPLDTDNALNASQDNLGAGVEEELDIDTGIATIAATSGTCGENVTWEREDGMLIISGYGPMEDYTMISDRYTPPYNFSSSPWGRLSGTESVRISYGVTNIGSYAFYLPAPSELTSVEIPDSVTSIGNHAFYYCSNLPNIEIPDSVASIGNGAFYYCSSLTSIKIPTGVTSIGNLAFYYCSSLSSIEIPSSVTNIGFNAFSVCTSLTDVYYKGDESDWANITIDEGNKYLTNATIHYNSTGMGGGEGDDPPVKPPVTPSNPDATDTSLQTFKKVYYYDTIAGTGVNVDLSWSWNYLLTWNSEIYNQSLARMGVALSASIEGSVADLSEILIGKDYDKTKGLGCDGIKYSATSPGAVFGHRTVIKSDGKTEHIIFVVVRGTTTASDILNDIKSGTNKGDWGASDVYSELCSCLADWSNTYGEINASNTKFFVTGHSLGGACANIISAQLNEIYGERNVFGYTFAAPSPFTSEPSKKCRNIHNFLCYRDNVPSRLSTQDPWYGNGYYTWFSVDESPQTSINYYTLTDKLWSDTYNAQFFFRLHAPSIYMAFLMTNPDLNHFSSKVNYIRAKCPVDIEVYNSSNELVGRIVNDEVDYDNYTSDVMLTVTDGAKCVYFLTDDTYTIKFSGTGDGTMIYTVASKDMNSNTIEESKAYSDVKINNDKKLESIVSSYDETNANNLVEIPDVELLVTNEDGNAIARVLSDNEAAASGESNGTEIPINNDDKPNNDKPSGNKPISKPNDSSGNNGNYSDSGTQSNSAISSSKSSSAKAAVESWKPTTPDEKKRYACMGKDVVQYTLPKDNAYRIVIENAMQGPMCFKSFEAVLGDYKIGRTYNIYTLPDTAYSMDKEIQFTIKIPSAIYKKDREYKMICVTKGGQPIVYNDLDASPETITVKTNKFYAYALIYK